MTRLFYAIIVCLTFIIHFRYFGFGWVLGLDPKLYDWGLGCGFGFKRFGFLF